MRSLVSTLRRAAILLPLAGALLAPAPAAQAGTSSLVLSLSASLFNDCLVSTNPLSFGSVSGLASSATATSSIQVICTLTTPYTVAIGAGNGAGATTTQRYMSNTSYKLGYVIAQDSAFTKNWGNTTDTVSGTGNGLIRNLLVYGKLSGANAVPAGLTLTDSVTVSVNF